ncbi:hypothetical protein A5906_37350 [Bradyrhizobium sacchari]|uniref:Uncharacterized protein n=1 Tax=Bradyrhizobium sacchari TaxID=1399419 RepID=A0A560K6U7_9BRAD|nr:hypothetical protein [Bradyrhizobium sacchari]OPY97119.1 hypothetical protein A5906_37350 [Bradyrhizobium sacchari]TWB55709.1 hypothetical protein FBZ94_107227 [Bradyrhizobium sacchari]TWB78982.1 hypothetical protein FBZ95_103832 [Bradyrhizobium sacchari]
MIARRILRLVLAVLVTAGLMAAPLVTPSAAHPMASDMQMTDAQDMSADMPCCPDERNSKQCQDCPLLAICALKVLQEGPGVATVTVSPRAVEQLRPLDDIIADGLVRPPPDHPPRSIV